MTASVEGRPLDERDLIVRARHGDTAAFTELVRHYQAIALRVAYLVTRDRMEAEDVTQDAFVKAYGALGRFRVDDPFRPWLLQIVRNEALNRVRGRARRERLALRSHDPASGDAAPSSEAAVVDRDEQERVLALIETLPERNRRVLLYRYVLDLPEKETAEILGIPVGTVKSRAARGLDELRNLMGSEDRA